MKICWHGPRIEPATLDLSSHRQLPMTSCMACMNYKLVGIDEGETCPEGLERGKHALGVGWVRLG